MILSPNNDKNKILDGLRLVKEYIKGDINNLNELEENCSNSVFKEIQKEINEISLYLEDKNKNSLSVYGEIMLTCEKLSDGYTNDKITTASSDPKLNYISKTLNNMFEKLDSTICDSLDVMNEYKKLNYIPQINTSSFRGGQLKNLLDGINNLRDEISDTLTQSFRESLVLEHEAMVLKDKARLLTKSTKNQASAIEETSASIVEITSSIVDNAKTTQEMLTLGNSVKNSSIKGEKLAEDTLQSMEDINSSTQKVYDSISAIDQIAFQTNILSLNAAVEAATAGEAGKGFAVVAQEVRNLASRSADAAKDIGSLMDELKIKAENGKNIANTMKTDYQDLTIDIGKTVTLIDGIVVSGKEQSIGISQVEEALLKIDGAVKENSSISDDVTIVSEQVYNVAKKILDTADKATFHGKKDIKIRENSLLRRDTQTNKSMRKD